MIEFGKIYNMDCLEGLRQMEDKSVDLLVTDPPYVFDGMTGGHQGKGKSKFAERAAKVERELMPISKGFDLKVLDECCRVLKKINAYVWCSRLQVLEILQYFTDLGCSVDILTWHKTNPQPLCANTYLSDTEYLIFARESGVKLYGEYRSKRKFWVTGINTVDKEQFGHPTIKPLKIIEQLIYNSSVEGGVVLDPFMGSGTTAVASLKMKRQFTGFELDKKFYRIANDRIGQMKVDLLMHDKSIKGTKKRR